MCGIVAILSRQAPIAETELGRALAALAHRGPDGRGHWSSEDRRVAIGHTRLAIVAPLAGAQPIASEDGSVIAAVSGELYGFEHVRRELAGRGHRFRTESDSEIVVHLWQERGIDCLQSLRGEFAFVLWDGRAGQLIAVRDRFGVRPLCYAETPGGVLIASEAKALFALGIEPCWDEASLHQSLRLQYPLPDRTLFRGVRQLEPGSALIAELGSVRVVRWWDFGYPTADASDRAADPHEVRELLDEAVRVRLRGESEPCVQLSGGIDSSAVLALAARALDKPLEAFTVSFEHDAYDELELARATAESVGAHLNVVRADTRRLLEVLPAAVEQGEGLAINLHLSAKYLLSAAIHAAGHKVVLTGEGSDEVFAGYAHLRRDLYGPIGALDASNRASAGSMLPEGESIDLTSVRQGLGFVPSFIEAKGTLGRRLEPLLSPEFRARFAGVDAAARLLASVDPAELSGRGRVEQSLCLWSRTALAGYILRTLGDGMEMAHSVEGRLPFLDHVLFERVRCLPTDAKIRDTTEKWILREALRGVVPERVRTREKHPFLAPPLCLAETALVQDVLRSQRFRSLPFFEHERVGTLLDGLPSLSPRERIAFDPALMLLTTASLLQESYGL